jgi:hypothetical protein
MPYTYEELSGALALAYGPHVVSGHVVKKTTVGTGDSAQTTVVVWLGEGVWNRIRGAYWGGAEIPTSDYHFHHGYLAESLAEATFTNGEWTQGVDPWNYGGIPYSGTAYVIVRLPQGVTKDDDFSKLKFICECLRVPDFDTYGNQIDSNGNVVSPNDGTTPLNEAYFTYSTNPARAMTDLLLVRRGLKRSRINWPAWYLWKQFSDVSVPWVGGEQAGRPTYTEVQNVVVGLEGYARKAWGMLHAWDGHLATAARMSAGVDGYFEVDPGKGTMLVGLSGVQAHTAPSDVEIFLRFQADGTLYLQNGETILSTQAFGWTANDRFKIAREGGVYHLYKNGSPIFTGVTLPTPSAELYGVAMFFDQDAEIIRSAFKPINSGQRERKRFECGLAFPDKTDIAAAMEAILLISCSNVQGDDEGRLVFLPPSMASAPRLPSFVFNMSNIREGTFKTYRTPREQKYTKFSATFRNSDTINLKEEPVEVTRDDMVDILGYENPYPEIYLGTMTKAQAKAVMNYQARVINDLDLFAAFEADGRSWPVLPGDISEVHHDVPGWGGDNPPQFIMLNADDLPSIDATADVRKFIGQIFDPSVYSDDDNQTPLGSNVIPIIPNVLIGPPPAVNINFSQESGYNANRIWTNKYHITIQLDTTFRDNQQIWVFSKHEDSSIPVVVSGSPFVPDAQGIVGFDFFPTKTGVYEFTTRTANRYGVIDGTATQLSETLLVSGAPVVIGAPANFIGQFGINTIVYTITPPVQGIRVGERYEIWKTSTPVSPATNRVTENAGENFVENYNTGSDATVYRWARIVDGMGNASPMISVNSGTGVVVNRLTAVSGFTVDFDGDNYIFTWTRLPDNANVKEYQIAESVLFSPVFAAAGGNTNTIARIVSGTSRSRTFYIRAIDFAGNIGPASTPITIDVPVLGAPTLELREGYRSSAVYKVTPPSNIRHGADTNLIIEVSPDNSFTVLTDAQTLDSRTSSFTINGTASLRATVYVRAYYKDKFGAGAFGYPNPATYTFQLFTGSDIADQVLTIAKFAATIKPPILVSSLPTLPDVNYPIDTIVSVTTQNGRLYRNIANVWQSLSASSFSDLSGQINAATQIANGSIVNALLAANAVAQANLQSGSVGAAQLAAGAVTPAALAVEIGGGNLVPNSSFEDVLTNGGYTSFNSSTISRVALASAYHGGFVIQGTKSGSNIINMSSAQGTSGIKVLPNKNYTFSYLVKPAGNWSGTWSAYINWYTSGGSLIGSTVFGTASAVTANGNWERRTLTALSPATAAYAAVGALCSAAGGNHYLDGFQLEEGTVPTAYAPTTGEILPSAVTTLMIAPGAIDYTKMASGLRPIETVAALPTLPSTTYPVNSYVVLSTDGRLYKNVANSWVDEVRTANLTGQIVTTQITDNAITTAKIIAGAVTATQIAANTITANQIAAGTITASQIAANTITAAQIAANTITTNQLAANSVQANNVAAGAITAQHLRIGTFGDNLVRNGSFEAITGTTPDGWAVNQGAGAFDSFIQSDAPSGDYVLRISPPTVSATGVGIGSIAIPVVPGETYVLQYKVKSSNGSGSRYIGLRYRADVPSNIPPMVTIGVSTGSDENATATWDVQNVANTDITTWTSRSFVFTPPAGTYWASVSFFLYNTTTGFLYIDDVSLRKQTTTVQIANGAVTAQQIAAATITGDRIAARTIVANNIVAATITANEIAARTITAGLISAGAITANEIAAGTITALQIAANTITAAQIVSRTITALQIAAGTITANEIAADTITAGQIAAGAISASEIAAGAIQAQHIGANQVTANAIAAGAIQAVHVAAGAVTADKIASALGTIGHIFTNQVVSNDYQPHSVNVPHTEQALWIRKFGVGTTLEGGLQKTISTLAWDSGACSSRGIFRGDGYIEWTAVTPSDPYHVMVGLNWSDDSYSYTDLNAAYYVHYDSTNGYALDIYEGGTYITTIAGAWAAGDVLRIAIEGNNIVYYKNGVAVRSRSAVGNSITGIQYPMRIDVSVYAPDNEVPPIFMYGIISDATRTSPIATFRDVLPLTATRSSDGNTFTNLTSRYRTANTIPNGDGFVEFQVPPHSIANGGWICGLTTGSSDTDFAFAVHHSVNGAMYSYEPAYGFVSTGYTYSTTGTDVYRIAIENGVVVYRHMGMPTPFRTSPSAVNQYPYRGMVNTSNSNGTAIAPGNLYMGVLDSEGQGWKLHPRQGSVAVGIGEFNEGVMVRNVLLTDAVARAAGGLKADGTYKGRDRAVIGTAEWMGFNDARRMIDGQEDVWFSMFFNTDTNQGAAANADSSDWMRLRVFNKFGEEIKYMYYPWKRRGVAAFGYHTRNFADPLEEAVYCFEPHNAFGYSRRFYFTLAPWVGAYNSGWANRGQVAPANWIARTNCPSNLSVNAASESSVILTWQPPTTATSQTVYYRRFGSSTWTVITSGLPITQTSYTATGLSANTLYEFMVHGSVSFSWSETRVVRTPIAPTAAPTLASPSGLSAAAASNSAINVNWVNGASTNTEVYFSTDGISFSLLTTVGSGVTTTQHTGLAATTKYWYRVRHNNGSVTSSYSNSADATTQAAPPPATAPNSCTATALGYYACRVNFVNPGDSARIEYGTDGSNFPNNTAYGVTSPANIAGLADGTTYYFRVRNSTGVSNIANATTDVYNTPDPDPVCITNDMLVSVVIDGQVQQLRADLVTDSHIVVSNVGEQVSFAEIEYITTGETSRVYTLTTENGYMLRCTPSHPIIRGYADDKGTPAALLTCGDSVLVYNSDAGQVELDRIAAIEYLDHREPVRMFHLKEGGSHTFAAGMNGKGGILSHNIKPRAL